MVNPLPAILIGGPPHAGKSVLFYSLTHALRQRGIRHHAIRACPDGEGNWSQESDATTVSQIRIPIRGEWPESFVKRICLDLEHRCLPFLVDMGGRPKESQTNILRQCTHAVLLLRTDRADDTQLWLRLIEDTNLLLLAQLTSQREGSSTLTADTPLLEGTLTGLERYKPHAAEGPLFEALAQRIAMLFNSYSPQELEQIYFEQAPTELVIDLYAALETYAPSSIRWTLEMLAPFLAGLPGDTPLSLYGAGPNWLYAALAAHAGQHPFYQFDPRTQFGWIAPVRVQLSTAHFPELRIHTRAEQEVTVLSIEIPSQHLEYFQPEPLPLPPVPLDTGLIISGKIPHWLLTAVVRLYKAAGVAWIAPYHVPYNKVVVIYSRVQTPHVGDVLPLPSS
jgi:CRISPR-associated protein Csx3